MPDIRLRVTQKQPIRLRVMPALIPRNAAATVGTVTTLPAGSPATVDNVGTPQNPVLNFGIPKGDPGLSVAAGGGIAVDNTDPANPIVSVAGGDRGDVGISPDGTTWTVENLAYILSRSMGGL